MGATRPISHYARGRVIRRVSRAVPWLGTWLSNRRERFIATGVGSELLLKLFDRE